MPDPERHPSAVVVPLRPGDGPGDRAGAPSAPPTRTRIKKLRLLALLAGLGALGAVSAMFGMLMAVASDLPALERLSVPERNSVVEDRTGRRLGLLTGSSNRILLQEDEITPVMEHAIIAIEDRRFYTNTRGVDFRSTGRALYQDLIAGEAVQGGSTITQQFVKNATAAQDERTVSNKIREAALAFHVRREWEPSKILRNYLNTIYFGNGAYGLEAAARTYFAYNHPDCGEDGEPRCAEQLEPAEAALIAGIVASPTGYDPLANRAAARRRRDLVLDRMRDQGYLDAAQYALAIRTELPGKDQVAPPREETTYPYFTSWVKQQVVDEMGGGQIGARRAFEGGLRIRTTIDSKLQDAAQNAVDKWLTLGDGTGPDAAVVVLDNASGEVRAMIGGPEDGYDDRPFNIATQGQRQPGSAFKPFVLAQALNDGISSGSTWTSKKQVIDVPNSSERFTVNNYEDAYAGVTTLADATTFSDNAVYAQVGIKVGTRRIARLSRRMGIRTPVSPNYAMTLGGLREGVTPLDLAHAYHTLASGGNLVYGSLSPKAGRFKGGIQDLPGPPAIDSIRRRGDESRSRRVITLPGGKKATNRRRARRVLREDVAAQTRAILSTVVKDGTGKRAALGAGQFAAGKTGTTEAYSDAWFVGFNKRYTVAVWVGYPEGFRSMNTEWKGDPVAGGTYPAAIWREFMVAAERAYPSRDRRRPRDDEEAAPPPDGTAPAPVAPAPDGAPPAAPEAPAAPEPEPDAPAAPGPVEPPPEPEPEAPAPAPAEPAPAQPAAPEGGAAPSAAG